MGNSSTKADQDVSKKQCGSADQFGERGGKEFIGFDCSVSFKDKRTAFLKDLSGPPLSLTLVLLCSFSNTKRQIELTVSESVLYQSVDKLKLVIEDHCNIPASCQRLTFGACTLEDQHSLDHYYLRNGDSLVVSFRGTANVKDILADLDNLRRFYQWMKSLERGLNEGILSNLQLQQIEQGGYYDSVKNLYQFYLSKRVDNYEVNREFFVECGGLVMLRLLHEELLQYPLSHLPEKLVLAETQVLVYYWNLSVSYQVAYLRMNKSVVFLNILRSLLRLDFNSRTGFQVPTSVYQDTLRLDQRRRWKFLTESLVQKAVGAICNFMDKPDIDIQLHSNEVLLWRLTEFLSCEVLGGERQRMVIMGGLLSLAFRDVTHEQLECIISNIMKEYSRLPDSKLFRYFVVMFFAFLLSTSHVLTMSSHREFLLDMYEKFFDQNTSSEIRELEIRTGFYWPRLLPYVKLAFHPFSWQYRLKYNKEDSWDVQRLQRYIIQCGIFSLSNVVQSENAIEALVKQNLLDYVMCIPWICPIHWTYERRQAEELVSYVGNHIQLQPPSLITITKARLAAMHFGLEKVLTLDIHQLMTEAYCKVVK